MNGFLGEIIHWSGAFPAIRYSGSISLTGPQAANEKPMLLKAFCQDDGENYVLDIKGGQRMSGSKSAPYISSLLVRSINMQ